MSQNQIGDQMENMNEDGDFAALLQTYAAPIADNGFTVSTLGRIEARSNLRKPVLIGAAILGGVIAASQMPSMLTLMNSYAFPQVQPYALTTLGLLSFVGWAALDKAWSDAV